MKVASTLLRHASWIFGVGVFSVSLQSQTALVQPNVDVFLIEPDRDSSFVELVAEKCSHMLVDVTTTQSGILVEIVAPNERVITKHQVAAIGGSFDQFEIPDTASMLGLRGYHQVFSLPFLGPGTYRVRATRPAGGRGTVGGVVTMITDSEIRMGFRSEAEDVTAGRAISLSVALFDGAAPILNATAVLTIRTPDGNSSTVVLHDDGALPDVRAGDGIYSAGVEMLQPGEYILICVVDAVDYVGAKFRRKMGLTTQARP